MTPSGNIRYYVNRITSVSVVWMRRSDLAQKSYNDGTTHVLFDSLDLIAKLAALVPKPSVNLTRFHGVFAPNSKCRIEVTLAKRGKGRPIQGVKKTPEQHHQAMNWARRLKRVFNIDRS